MDVQTQRHLKTLRQLLERLLADFAADSRADQAAVAADSAALAETFDSKDRAQLTQRAESDDSRLARDLGHLVEVRDALRRLDGGHYGDCESCGEHIPFQRLLVQPTATRCAACQAESERNR